MQGDEVALLAIFVFLAGALVGEHVHASEQFWTATLTSLVTLAAAFSGAWYAFKLQANKAKGDLEVANVRAANRAILELARAYNTLNAIDRQFVDPVRHSPARHFQLRPASGLPKQRIAFDYDALAFVFESTDKNFSAELSLLELEVNSTLELLQHHSELHRTEFQPKVEEAGVLHSQTVMLSRIEQIVGPRLTQTLRDITNDLVEGIERDKADLIAAAKRLRTLARALYPGHTIVGLVVDKKPTGFEPKGFKILDQQERPKTENLWTD